MRQTTLLAVASSFLALAACSSGPHPTPPGGPAVNVDQASVARDPASSIDPGSVAAAAAANNAFAFDLYAHVRSAQTTPGNLLTSPISASLALTMTYAGAQGQTATEMAAALHYGPAAATIFDGQNGLAQALDARAASALAAATTQAGNSEQPAPSADDYQLQVVNSVWGEKTYTWEQPFLTTLAKSYGTGVYVEDFVHQWDPARQTINGWVSSATADKINDLLPDGSLDASTRMVLVNAVHLKLPWATPFQTAFTKPAPFTRADGSSVTASFMNGGGNLPYADDGKAQIVAIPLMGGEVSVVLAIPHGDLAPYEAALTAAAPGALAVPLTFADVTLSLPKTAFTSPTFSLAKPLQAMGMVQAFDSAQANLKGLCGTPPDGGNLYVSDVLQKTMLAMQENGVEAAAATAVIIGTGAAPSKPIPVVADHPYVVAIVDGPTGAILFLGHITDPTDAGGP